MVLLLKMLLILPRSMLLLVSEKIRIRSVVHGSIWSVWIYQLIDRVKTTSISTNKILFKKWEWQIRNKVFINQNISFIFYNEVLRYTYENIIRWVAPNLLSTTALISGHYRMHYLYWCPPGHIMDILISYDNGVVSWSWLYARQTKKHMTCPWIT